MHVINMLCMLIHIIHYLHYRFSVANVKHILYLLFMLLAIERFPVTNISSLSTFMPSYLYYVYMYVANNGNVSSPRLLHHLFALQHCHLCLIISAPTLTNVNIVHVSCMEQVGCTSTVPH